MKLAVLFWVPLLIAGTTIRENQMVAPGGGPGGLANGTLVITPSAPFTTPAGSRVEVIAREFPVRSGKVTIVLEPNDLGIPDNTRYLVTYKTAGWRRAPGCLDRAHHGVGARYQGRREGGP